MDAKLSVIVTVICLSGIRCEENGLCHAYTTDCPVGKLCYGDCPPNIACDSSSGVEICEGCVPGWKGMHCSVDEDECTYMGFSPCENNGVCENTEGDYKCNCFSEWIGKDCKCKKGSACDPTADASQISPRSIGSLMVLSVSIVWSRIGVSLE